MKKLAVVGAFIVVLAMLFWLIPKERMDAAQKHKADGSYEYAVVLGAKVNGETPSLSLRYRLESAAVYAKRYPHVTLVLSGGQGKDEEISEAQAMFQYLIDQGIAKERLIQEDRSTSTYENLQFSKELLPEVAGVTIISSDFHLARARFLARQLGWQSDVVAAKTPEIVKTKVSIRERLALLKTWIFRK
ncbi:YdcF family protein [Sporosarcina sp.]|uniref:YdcF family protein n=1 Tax=Sporosarcina sp. TaxID=49982 RepID=UPI0026131C95|nr:YdcF family protein [Sporosarcina sp.]